MNPKSTAPSTSAVRRLIYFSGQVQGVGFRQTTRHVASRFRVTGYVRNLPDGRVELVAEGDAEELDRFQSALCETMKPYIHHIDATVHPTTGEFDRFTIAR